MAAPKRPRPAVPRGCPQISILRPGLFTTLRGYVCKSGSLDFEVIHPVAQVLCDKSYLIIASESARILLGLAFLGIFSLRIKFSNPGHILFNRFSRKGAVTSGTLTGSNL
jgi:hypothetical protein